MDSEAGLQALWRADATQGPDRAWGESQADVHGPLSIWGLEPIPVELPDNVPRCLGFAQTLAETSVAASYLHSRDRLTGEFDG